MSNPSSTGINIKSSAKQNGKPPIIGWREWVALPDLGIPAIKVKVDTGAKTSALHTFKLETFKQEGREFVRFWIHPLQKRTDIEIVSEALIIDKRTVKDSGGHAEERYVIKTPVRLGNQQWDIELTLTSREDMLFRMLFGRSAISDGNLIVNPETSFMYGRKPRNIYKSR